VSKSLLPTKITRGYWIEVCNRLQAEHMLKPNVACRAIRNYRGVLAADGVGDIMYHAPIEETVEGIFYGGYVDDEEKLPQG